VNATPHTFRHQAITSVVRPDRHRQRWHAAQGKPRKVSVLRLQEEGPHHEEHRLRSAWSNLFIREVGGRRLRKHRPLSGEMGLRRRRGEVDRRTQRH
jgi:hypothetical protein